MLHIMHPLNHPDAYAITSDHSIMDGFASALTSDHEFMRYGQSL